MRRLPILPLIVVLAACGETTDLPDSLVVPDGAALASARQGKLETPAGPTVDCPAAGQDEGWCTAGWGAVDGADAYEMVIQGAGGTQRVETPATSATFEEPWSANDWCVKVRALAPVGQGDNSSQYSDCVGVDGEVVAEVCGATEAPLLTIVAPAPFPFEIERKDYNLNQNSILDLAFSGTVDWKGDDSGLTTSLTYAVDDEYDTTASPPYTAMDVATAAVAALSGAGWSQTLALAAYKLGGDDDGHSYVVTVTATNCFDSTVWTGTVVFDHDSGNGNPNASGKNR